MNDFNIINFLSYEKRATAREVAAEIGGTPEEAVSALLRLEAQGKAQQLNGYWFVSENEIQTEQSEDSE